VDDGGDDCLAIWGGVLLERPPIETHRIERMFDQIEYQAAHGRATTECGQVRVVAGRLSLGEGQEVGGLRDDLRSEGYRLCYRAEPPRGHTPYGVYSLIGPVPQHVPLTLSVRFWAGMSVEPMFFVIDHKRTSADLEVAHARCDPPREAARLDGVGRILDATHNSYPSDVGRWAVDAVY